MGNLDSGGKTVADESANFGFENRNQIRELAQVVFRAMNRCREVAFQGAGDVQDFCAIPVLNQERCRTEDFVRQLRILQE